MLMSLGLAIVMPQMSFKVMPWKLGSNQKFVENASKLTLP